MRIAVIGANGRSGQAFVDEAIKNGHTINAGYLRHNPFTETRNLKAIKCDATKLEDLNELIDGCDAVVSLIGHVKGSPKSVQTDSIKVAIEAMNHKGVKRLISLTGTGVRLPGDKITLADRFLNFGVGLVDPRRVKDGKDHYEIIKQSQLNWTVIRVLKLQNIKPRSYKLLAHGPTKIFVGRQEVAQAILEVLENDSYVKQAPIIGS